jgi:TonB family protein
MNLRGLLGVVILLGMISTASPEQAPSTQVTQPQIGEQAIRLILSRYTIDPNNPVAKTGKPLRADGKWALGKETPQACPKADNLCVRVFYRVPDVDVTCEWTVLLRGKDEASIVLDLNEDAARYLTVRSAGDQVKLKKLSGEIPRYPFIAREAHVTGSVKMLAHIDTTGHVDKITVISGPEPLRDSAVKALKTWVYEPLVVESSAIPLQALITINFNIAG